MYANQEPLETLDANAGIYVDDDFPEPIDYWAVEDFEELISREGYDQ